MHEAPLPLPMVVKMATRRPRGPIHTELPHASSTGAAAAVRVDVLGVERGKPDGAVRMAVGAGDGAFAVGGHRVGVGGGEEAEEREGECGKMHFDGVIVLSECGE
jgi:hypothetical protein